MIFKYIRKILPLFFVLVLITTNLAGMSFGDIEASTKPRSVQPYNSFKENTMSGSSNQENEKYGWNMTYIENLNGDEFGDFVIGTPWYDKDLVIDVGAIYIFFGKEKKNEMDFSNSAASAIITGVFDSDQFGWDVASAGDVNGDGIDDLIVGAPCVKNDRGRAYIIYGGAHLNGKLSVKDVPMRILDGQDLGVLQGSRYGSAVAGIGDLNKDGYDDVLVGAPGTNQAIITYGYKSKVKFYPDLWDDDPSSVGKVTFDKGAYNSVNDSNTWGLNGNDDGWDWIDSFDDPDKLYGHTDSATIDHATLYGPWEPDGPDADGLAFKNKTALEVMVGRNHTHLNPYGDGWDWDPAASAAWGIEFTITNEMYKYLASNSSITIGFDYETVDANVIYNNSNLSRRYIYNLRTRIWNSTGKYYLGNDVVNNEKYVFYKQDNWNVPPWGPEFGTFEWEITEYIEGPETYYWDFGCYFDGGWATRYDDGMIAWFDNVTMNIHNDKSIVIQGPENSGFGTALIGLGDINNDGYPDWIIGAPAYDSGLIALFHGKERLNEKESINLATTILTGTEPGDKFGFSISNSGDADFDGILDVIIGAPGGNYACLYYGSTLNTGSLVPDLWEVKEDSNTPQIEFDSGLKSTGNTPDITGANDGWDVWNGVYGYQNGAQPGSSVKYNGGENPNSENVANDDELIIAIGGGYGGGLTTGAKPDSGAYGVKFSINQKMMTTIEAGGRALLSYDWQFENIGLDQDETIWIKSSIRSNTETFDLGWDLDKDAGVGGNKDDTFEIHWATLPNNMKTVFVQDCSECFSEKGSYYLDVGAKVRSYWWENGAYEDGIFHFDNIHLRINPPPDAKFLGPMNSSFGFSVGFSNKLNDDDFADVVIGAPLYDSANGKNSGAVFGFIMEPESEKLRIAETAEFITYGEAEGDNFGWTILGINSMDSDKFTEILASAINYDSSSINTGKIYLLSISKGPRIVIINPDGSKVLVREVVLNAKITDPDNNIDLTQGVFFYYSTDKINWKLIGNVIHSSDTTYEHFEYVWNTTQLPDGTNYFIKGWVQDLEFNKGENISAPLCINNLHPPSINFKNPKPLNSVEGIIDITVIAKDNELDLIDGGINTTKGVEFYFSTDDELWELLGTDLSGKEDIYSVTFDTTLYPDGMYWLKAKVSDLDGTEEEVVTEFLIDNPSRPPKIQLISPLDVTELVGEIKVKAIASDFDCDINSTGVSFYILTEIGPTNWITIGSDAEPEYNSNGDSVYSILWDSTTVPDDWYLLKAFVNDTEGNYNESITDVFKIHNNENNPPYIELIYPNNGNVLIGTQVITAYVRDLEDNVDSNGVDFYYSSDGVQWRFLGSAAEPRTSNNDFYDFNWATDTIPDGKYWLKVSVADEKNLRAEDISEKPILIHNSELNSPVVKIITPEKRQHINGTFLVTVTAVDLENNINTVGVRLYFSLDGIDWTVISNIPKPTQKDDSFFELTWDTTKYPDGRYWLKAEATDFTELKGIDTLNYFYIHNNMDNEPKVKFLKPASHELSGLVKLNATVFDLENNINDQGVKFYYSIDNKTWILIKTDQTGTPSGDLTQYFEIFWDTTQLDDGIYWLRAEVEDQTNKIGIGTFNSKIIIHNNQNNPPIIKLKQPQDGIPLAKIQSIIVEVTDFEDDVVSVSFFYSKNKESWTLIDTVYKPNKNNVYYTRWNTEELYNGKYYLKILAIDELGNQDTLTTEAFELKEGKENKERTIEEFPYWIIAIIIVALILILIIFLALRRVKRREEELIEEVSSEIIKSQVLNGEIVSEPKSNPIADRNANNANNSTQNQIEIENGLNPIVNDKLTQTYYPPLLPPPTDVVTPEYEPDVDTIEFYKKQMDTWKDEGYNVSDLEQIYYKDENEFAKTFSIYSSNISRLKNISGKLSSMNLQGFEAQVKSITDKLYKPDLAMVAQEEFNELRVKLGFTPQSAPNQSLEIPSPIEDIDADENMVPPDVLLPDVDVDPNTSESEFPVSPFVEGDRNSQDSLIDDSGIPCSPYLNVQTQALQDELKSDTKIVELPSDSEEK